MPFQVRSRTFGSRPFRLGAPLERDEPVALASYFVLEDQFALGYYAGAIMSSYTPGLGDGPRVVPESPVPSCLYLPAGDR